LPRGQDSRASSSEVADSARARRTPPIAAILTDAVTVARAVEPGTDFDQDKIAELFWTARNDSKDAWQTEYRFTGA